MTNDNLRTDANRQELKGLLSEHCKVDGETIIAPGLNFYRQTAPTAPTHGIYLPSVCVVAQGAKEVQIAEERLRYDPSNYLLISLDVPVVSQVVGASLDKPYLCLRLEFDPAVIASVILESGIASRNDGSVKSMVVSELSGDILDAFVRLIKLLDDPSDFRVVSPMVIREIIYRLLKGEQGSRLQQMAAFGGTRHRIAKAIQTLRTRFNEPIGIEELASELGMSVSSFHQHFKTATSMSPLQYQKVLRLQEARRLLLSGEVDASTAASRVGYDDASQFTREYKRLFGNPPMRDVSQFRQPFTSTLNQLVDGSNPSSPKLPASKASPRKHYVSSGREPTCGSS